MGVFLKGSRWLHPVPAQTALCTAHVLSALQESLPAVARTHLDSTRGSPSLGGHSSPLGGKSPLIPPPAPMPQLVPPHTEVTLTHQPPPLGFEQTQSEGSILTFRGPAPGLLTGAQQSLQDKPVPNVRAAIPRQETWDRDAYLESNKGHPQLCVPRVLANLPVQLLHPGLEERALSVGL